MDSGKEDGSQDIRDDDLNKWFNELRQHATNITFIFDSCHSGTATRGTGSRSIERGGKGKTGTRGGDDVALNETMDESETYVTISGSLPNEKSQEDSLPVLPKPGEKTPNEKSPKMQMNGYMTYYLVQKLRENRGLSYRELMQLVSTAVNKASPDQTPQVEGDVERAFLGSKESRGKRSIPIMKIEKEGGDTILTIEAGRIVGALPGGAIGIYSENAAELTGERDRLAVGTIVESLNFTSKVRVEGKDIPPGAKIILANPFFTNEKRAVAIDTSGADAASQKMQKLKILLNANDYVRPLETQRSAMDANPKQWNIAVVRGTFGEFKQGKTKSGTKDGKMPGDKDDGFYLANPNGNPLYDFWIPAAAANVEEEIKKALELHTRVENLSSLDNAAGQVSGGLEIEMVRLKSFKLTGLETSPCEFEEYTAAERKKMKEENTPLNPGDWFYFLLTARIT